MAFLGNINKFTALLAVVASLVAPLSPAQEGDVAEPEEISTWEPEIRETPVPEDKRAALKEKYEAFVRCGKPLKVYLNVNWEPDNGSFDWCGGWAGRRLWVGDIAPQDLREMLTCPGYQYIGDTWDYWMYLRLEQENGEVMNVAHPKKRIFQILTIIAKYTLRFLQRIDKYTLQYA